MKTNKIITLCYLRSQGVELLCGRLRLCTAGLKLSFSNRMHDFNASDGTARSPERFEPEHRSHHTLYGPMILLHDIIEIFRLPNDNGYLVHSVVARDRRRVAPTLIDRDLLWKSLGANCLT